MISTPLMRGETPLPATCRRESRNFNPLPSCEGRRIYKAKGEEQPPFQSAPLMRGETVALVARGTDDRDFNPLPSCEGRRPARIAAARCWHFNPLPSCEGRQIARCVRARCANFNPLPSYEGRRRKRSHERWLDQQFQSTPLMRGETARWRQVPWTYCHFNPLPSYEGRPKDCFRRCSS